LSLWMKSYGVTIQMPESYTEQYFPVVLLIMSYKVVLTSAVTSDSVDEILWCKHQDSNESY